MHTLKLVSGVSCGMDTLQDSWKSHSYLTSFYTNISRQLGFKNIAKILQNNGLTINRAVDFPGLGTDLWKDNARPNFTMKRPYSTHLSYEKILAGL